MAGYIGDLAHRAEYGICCPTCGKKGWADYRQADATAAEIVEQQWPHPPVYRYKCPGVLAMWHLTRMARSLDGKANVLASEGSAFGDDDGASALDLALAWCGFWAFVALAFWSWKIALGVAAVAGVAYLVDRRRTP